MIAKEWEECYKNSDRKPNIPSMEEVESMYYVKHAEADKAIDIFADELFSNRQDEIKESLKNLFTSTEEMNYTLKDISSFAKYIDSISETAKGRIDNVITNSQNLDAFIKGQEQDRSTTTKEDKDASLGR